MKKIANRVKNFIKTLFHVLIIHYGTIKPKIVTKSTLFLVTFIVLLCSAQLSVSPMWTAIPGERF